MKPNNFNVPESGGFHRILCSISSSLMEKYRPHIRGNPLIHNREDLGPAAVFTLSPNGEPGTSAGLQHSVHFMNGLEWIGHVHEAQRTEGSIAGILFQVEIFGIHSLKLNGSVFCVYVFSCQIGTKFTIINSVPLSSLSDLRTCRDLFERKREPLAGVALLHRGDPGSKGRDPG